MTNNVQAPLMLVLLQVVEAEEGARNSNIPYFFGLQGKVIHIPKHITLELHKSLCVGSSQGWLLLLDEEANPKLFNPFLGSRVQLPPKETFSHIVSASKKDESDDSQFLVTYKYGNSLVTGLMTVKELQRCLVSKAALFTDGVIVIDGLESKLSFFKNGDDTWTELDHGGKHKPYSDIVCHDNKLLALSKSSTIEIWDFNGSNYPRKLVNIIQASFPGSAFQTWKTSRGLYSSRFYLVESAGDVLLAARFVGEFVRHDGVPVCEADLLTDEDTQPLICPYKTLWFQVYKLNIDENRWEEVADLGSRSLFLGGNQSVSLSAEEFSCEANSIYFTDDYWERMNEDYLYGGHDLGMFSLKSRSITRSGNNSRHKPVTCNYHGHVKLQERRVKRGTFQHSRANKDEQGEARFKPTTH
ncbi:hypothetical protein RJ639_032248 [Escallonia herrerae]|uniref:KIB1-4 beta-propeller domain-containing protein n=1 Tax=Escallonia herrerae TaxID=1293975 RepID=A0AA89BAB1_9ASTE|nr:hypothetical protein RJ639_032248 [Escallonia herrerae]